MYATIFRSISDGIGQCRWQKIHKALTKRDKYYKPFIFAFCHMKTYVSHRIGDWEIIRPGGLKMIWKKKLKHSNFSKDKVFRLFFAMDRCIFSLSQFFFHCVLYCLMTMMVFPTTWWLFVLCSANDDGFETVCCALYIEYWTLCRAFNAYSLSYAIHSVCGAHALAQNTDYKPFSHFDARHKAKDHSEYRV